MSTEPNRHQKRIYADQILLVIGLFLLLLFAALELLIRIAPQFSVHAVMRTVFMVIICVLLYFGARMYQTRTDDPTRLRHAFYLFFILYLYLILTFTLIDPTLGRDGDFLNNNVKYQNEREHYIKWFVNLVPFRSIYEVYILGLVRGYVKLYYTLFNLLGNLCAFMPLAFFLPLFCKPLRKWYFFLPAILLSTAAVEALQFLFMVGSCDIDDVILNAGGAIILFFLLKIPIIQKLCEKLLHRSFS